MFKSLFGSITKSLKIAKHCLSLSNRKKLNFKVWLWKWSYITILKECKLRQSSF